jgi:post-segregation antitoxin (ccd killing protein)
MAQINIYVPDALRERIKVAGLNVSRICQTALEQAAAAQEARLQTAAATAGTPCENGHVGQRKRLPWGNICDACGRKWEA